AATDVSDLAPWSDPHRAELEERGRLGWAIDKFEQHRPRHAEQADPEVAWWRIKEARRLKGRARCVAQAVAAWRERRARTVDRPVRHVLPDLSVVAIAERPPKDARELARVRGVDGRHLKGGAAEELLAAVREGLELPEEALRLP